MKYLYFGLMLVLPVAYVILVWATNVSIEISVVDANSSPIADARVLAICHRGLGGKTRVFYGVSDSNGKLKLRVKTMPAFFSSVYFRAITDDDLTGGVSTFPFSNSLQITVDDDEDRILKHDYKSPFDNYVIPGLPSEIQWSMPKGKMEEIVLDD